jgi:hypothetical protein
VNRKTRKEAIERKRNKKQYINAENEIKDRKSVARHKRYLILKEKREAKHPKTNNSVAHQQYVNGSSCIDMINEDNNSETSSGDEDTGDEYVTS